MPKLVNSLESIVHRLRAIVNCQLLASLRLRSGSIVNCRLGFSLVEILIVISVVSLLGLLGFSSLKGTQASARDAQRKSDFEAIETALELYYQAKGEYTTNATVNFPGPGGYWNTSIPSIPWIPGLTKSYIADLPRDPIDKGSSRYYYQSDNDPGCPPAKQWTAIATQLEDVNDPDSLKNKDVIWCDGITSLQDELPPNWYIKVIKAN